MPQANRRTGTDGNSYNLVGDARGTDPAFPPLPHPLSRRVIYIELPFQTKDSEKIRNNSLLE